MSNIEERLRNDAERWQSAQAFGNAVDLQSITGVRPVVRNAHRFGMSPLRIGAVAAAAAVIFGGVNLVQRQGSQGDQAVSSGPVPLAQKPLLNSMPAPTKLIELATGRSSSISWQFSAKMNALKSTTPPGATAGLDQPGVCIGVTFDHGSASACDPPSAIRTLAWESVPADQWFPLGNTLLYGITSSAAASVSITFAGSTTVISAKTIADPAFPGLHFFDAVVPAGYDTTVVAVASSGQPIERSETYPISSGVPPIPPAGTSPFVGFQPFWPMDPTAPARFGTPAALAEDFSTTVLGLAKAGITTTPAPGAPGRQLVTITAPGLVKPLQAIAAQQGNGSWGFMEVGVTQANGTGTLTGTLSFMMVSGQLSLGFTAPPGTANAESFQRTDLGYSHGPLTSAQLHDGKETLPGKQVESAIVVFRNRHGDIVGVFGS